MPDALGRRKFYATVNGGLSAFTVWARTRDEAHAEAVAEIVNPRDWRPTSEYERRALARRVRVLTPDEWDAQLDAPRGVTRC